MLIKFKDLVNQYEIPRGIIHIGAHKMEERNDYLEYGLNNTIWIEANPSIYSSLISQSIFPDERIFNYAIFDKTGIEMDLNITNNGESSSLLQLDKHKLHHPHIHVVATSRVQTMRMDDLIQQQKIDMNNYNFVNLDIQGVELLALKGFGSMLSYLDYIYTEINTSTLYENCCLVEEIDKFLLDFGFERILTSLTEFEWGDAFYIKKDKKIC